MSCLEGRVAIITGSSRGIGREPALRLADEGADVVVTSETVAEEVRRRGRTALSVRGSAVREEEDTRARAEGAVEELGRLDILVNAPCAPPNDGELSKIHLRAAYLSISYGLPRSSEAAGGTSSPSRRPSTPRRRWSPGTTR